MVWSQSVMEETFKRMRAKTHHTDSKKTTPPQALPHIILKQGWASEQRAVCSSSPPPWYICGYPSAVERPAGLVFWLLRRVALVLVDRFEFEVIVAPELRLKLILRARDPCEGSDLRRWKILLGKPSGSCTGIHEKPFYPLWYICHNKCGRSDSESGYIHACFFGYPDAGFGWNHFG